MCLLNTRGLSRSYDGRRVVDKFDAVVHAGEVVVLLGPNGCGKTTSIEMALGLRSSDGGESSICGLDPRSDRREVAKKIGVQLQGAHIHPRVKLREYFDFLGALYGDRSQVTQVVQSLGLSDQMPMIYSKLSGGQQRRAMVAAALCGHPQLAVLDEPTSGVDPESRTQFWAAIRQMVRDTGLGVLTTTHDLGEAARHATRVMIMRRGRVVREGTCTQLLDELPFTEIRIVRGWGAADLAGPGSGLGGVILQRIGDEVIVGLTAQEAGAFDDELAAEQPAVAVSRRNATMEDVYLYTGILEGEAR